MNSERFLVCWKKKESNAEDAEKKDAENPRAQPGMAVPQVIVDAGKS
jgi:hypothetical protein